MDKNESNVKKIYPAAQLFYDTKNYHDPMFNNQIAIVTPNDGNKSKIPYRENFASVAHKYTWLSAFCDSEQEAWSHAWKWAQMRIEDSLSQ